MTIVSFSQGKGSLNAIYKIQTSEDMRTNSIRKISSSLRVDKTADSVADAAIGTRIKIETDSLRQILIASHQSLATLEIADGALTELKNNLSRMKTLTIQSINSQLTNNDREKIENEFLETKKEVDRIVRSTSFNDRIILNGDSIVYTDSFNAEDTTIPGYVPLRNKYLTSDFTFAGGFESITFDNDVEDDGFTFSYNADTKKLRITRINEEKDFEDIQLNNTEIPYGSTEKLRFNKMKVNVNLNHNFDKKTSFGKEYSDSNIPANLNNAFNNSNVNLSITGAGTFYTSLDEYNIPVKSDSGENKYMTTNGMIYTLDPSVNYINPLDGKIYKKADGQTAVVAPGDANDVTIKMDIAKKTVIPIQNKDGTYARDDQSTGTLEQNSNPISLEKAINDNVLYVDDDGYVRFVANAKMLKIADSTQNPPTQLTTDIDDSTVFTENVSEAMKVKMSNVTHSNIKITKVSGKAIDLKTFNITASGSYGAAQFKLAAEDGDFYSVKTYNLTNKDHDPRAANPDNLSDNRLTQGVHTVELQRRVMENGEQRIDTITVEFELFKNSDIDGAVNGQSVIPENSSVFSLNTLRNTVLLYKKQLDTANFQFQVGTKNNDYDRITMFIPAVNTKKLGLDENEISLATDNIDKLQYVSKVMDNAINMVINCQSTVAITYKRIQATNSSIQINVSNSQLAANAIFDLDIPSEMVTLSQREMQQTAAIETLSRDIRSQNNLLKLFQ